MGLIKENEDSEIKLKVKKQKASEEFSPSSGEQNTVKSEKPLEKTLKVFEFISKPLEEECPNLQVKKSAFITFDEIVKKVDNKAVQFQPSVSFIEESNSVKLKDVL